MQSKHISTKRNAQNGTWNRSHVSMKLYRAQLISTRVIPPNVHVKVGENNAEEKIMRYNFIVWWWGNYCCCLLSNEIKLYRVRNLLQCDFVSLICPDLFVLVRRLSFTPPLTLARWSHSLSVLNFCFYTLLPSKSQQCNARMLAEQRSGRMRRDVYSFLDTSFDFVNINWKNITSMMPDLKCERVDPKMKQMLREKFDIAISYSGRFISNILRYFTNSKRIEGVRKSLAFCCCLV